MEQFLRTELLLGKENLNKYRNIYLYDDCFLTTNQHRLEEIIDLLSRYPFRYYIAVRYEMCTPQNFSLLSKLSFSQVQT